MKRIGIYKITNLRTKKFYLGSSVNIDHRWRQHKCLLNKNKHHSAKLQASWNKYGAAAFVFEVLLECKPNDIIDVEQALLIELNPAYNISAIAGRVEMTSEVKKKISEATKQRYKRYDGLTLKEYCTQRGANWKQVYRRLARGCTIEEALAPVDTLRTKEGARRLDYKGTLYTQNELASLAQVSPATMSRRLKSGMTVAQAVEATAEDMLESKRQKSSHTYFKQGFDPRRRKKKQ